MSRILLIEPNRILGKTYCQALERAGHSVLWQANGQSAILSADEQAPEVVVLELQLPGHSGIEFLYEFRSYPEWQFIPVIIHTFTPDQFTLTQKHDLGVVRYFYKPATTLQQFVRAVNVPVVSL